MQITINLMDPTEVHKAIDILVMCKQPSGTKKVGTHLGASELFKGVAQLPNQFAAPSIVVVDQSSTVPVETQLSLTLPTELPAPVVTAVPEVAVQPAPPTSPASDVDAKGLPWDHRIHASSKAKNADGSWRAKRGVDAALVTLVEDELRMIQRNPVIQGVGVPGLGDPIEGVITYSNATPIDLKDPAVVFGAQATLAPTTLAELMPRVSAAVIAGKLAPTAIGDACAKLGVASVVALQAAPQFVQQVFELLRQQCGDL